MIIIARYENGQEKIIYDFDPVSRRYNLYSFLVGPQKLISETEIEPDMVFNKTIGARTLTLTTKDYEEVYENGER